MLNFWHPFIKRSSLFQMVSNVVSFICQSLGEELFERPIILMEIFGVIYK